MLELGNKGNGNGTYKSYLSKMIDHTSIDINGLDGALPMDLNTPIDLPPFDMVTNIGTTEHVSNQESVWKNIHNLTKQVFVSVTPLPGDWVHHGTWYPTFEFYEGFTKNGYEIELMDVAQNKPKRVIRARMKKITHRPFVMSEGLYHNERG